MTDQRKPVDLESLRGHTPGPWKVSVTPRNTRIRVVNPEDGTPVATVDCASANTQEAKQTAALIAASEAMLAELTERRARDEAVRELVDAATWAEKWMRDDGRCDGLSRLRLALAAYNGAAK